MSVVSLHACPARQAALATASVRTLVADPPWQFADRLPGPSRGAERHYPCMTLAELVGFRDTWDFDLAGDAYLLLWRVASMQEEALALVAAWGFRVKTELVWLKRTTSGKRWFGMGRTLRAEHEVCLVASRGRPRPLNLSTRTTFPGLVRGHSAKPDEFYALVEETFPAPRAELFARQRRPGWIQRGNELPAQFAPGEVARRADGHRPSSIVCRSAWRRARG